MGKLASVHPTIVLALCVHEAFRACGYPPDDIYVAHSVDQDDRQCLFVQAEYGDKKFLVNAGELALGDSQLEPAWMEAVGQWNDKGNSEEVRELWENSRMRKQLIPFMYELSDRGMLRTAKPFVAPEAEA